MFIIRIHLEIFLHGKMIQRKKKIEYTHEQLQKANEINHIINQNYDSLFKFHSNLIAART
jgi:hypothetical protein